MKPAGPQRKMAGDELAFTSSLLATFSKVLEYTDKCGVQQTFLKTEMEGNSAVCPFPEIYVD